MFGVLRITKAEFIKIFKKPSVYVMGLLLALVIVISFFTFDPVNAFSYTPNLTGTNVSTYYNDFTGSYKDDSKNILDSEYQKAVDNINFQLHYANYTTRIAAAKSGFDNSVAALKNAITLQSDDVALNTIFEELKINFQKLTNEFTATTSLNSNAIYIEYLSTLAYKNYYSTTEIQDITTGKSRLGYLNILEEEINNSQNLISRIKLFPEYYKTNGYSEKLSSIADNFILKGLLSIVESVQYHFEEFNTLIRENTGNDSGLNHILNFIAGDISGAVKSYQDYITKIESDTDYVAFIKNSDFIIQNDYLFSMIKTIDDRHAGQFENEFEKYTTLNSKLLNGKLIERLRGFTGKIIEARPNTEQLENLKEYVTEIIVPLQISNSAKITEYVSEIANIERNETREDSQKLLDLIEHYKVLQLNAKNYINNTIVLNAVENTSFSNPQLYNNELSNYNQYRIKEANVRIGYQLENGVYISDYANTFSFNQKTSGETTVYDFMFYSLKISSIIIIVFAIIMSSNILAYEFDTGTIKLLAIRPFKRGKILFGKLLAVLFFVITFVIFSSIISFFVGLSSYSLALTPILAVFNASTAFVIGPIQLILLNIVFILIEIMFYTIISLALSTIFRSFSTAMSMSMVFLVLGILLNTLFSGFLWYSYIPFVNTDMFRYFGGVFTNYDSSLAGTMLSNTLVSNSDFLQSIIIYGITISVSLIISYMVFKRRDI